MVNRVFIVGRLGADPETHFSQSGNPVTVFRVATDDGTKENPETNWHRVVVFGKQAEVCAEYLGKGRLVCVEGRIRYRQYTGRDGEQRTVTEIVASRVVFLGNGRAQETGEHRRESGARETMSSGGTPDDGVFSESNEPEPEDDLFA